MKKQLLVACMFAALACTSCARQEMNKEQMIRVPTPSVSHAPQGPTVRLLVLEDVEGALVEVKGGYNAYDPFTGKKLDTAFFASSYYMHTTTDGIKWGAEFPGVYQILLVPDHANASILVQGVEYKGMIYAYQVDGALNFVNEVSVNDYAKSLISDLTAKKTLERESLAALLIAARGDGFYHSQHPKSKYWDVKASQVAYRGSSICRVDNAFNEVADETDGMILRAHKDIGWFEAKNTPVDEIEKEGVDGKHARAILSRYFPGSEVTLFTSEK